MRTPLILISVLLWAWSPSTVSAYDVTITGTDPGDPTKTNAELATGNAGDGHRIISREQRAKDMPIMCQLNSAWCVNENNEDALTLKTFPGLLPASITLPLDCQRACRNPCYGDPDEFACTKICTLAGVKDGQCYLKVNNASCTVGPYLSGATLYLPTEPFEICTPAGFPEDLNSKEYCQWVDLECPDTDTEYEFEPELRTCRATCTSSVFCNSVWYDENRWCHLRRNRCSALSDFASKPGTTTLIVRLMSEKGKPCPAGSTIYVAPQATFYDQYCKWQGLTCDLPEETDMYYGSKTPNRGYPVGSAAECIDKCTHIFTCGSAWTVTDPTNPAQLNCVMQRLPPRCPSKHIVASDDPTQWLFLRIGMDEGDPATVTDNDALSALCSKYYVDTIPWRETYCGFEDNKCSAAVITAAPFSLPVSCLTACRSTQGCSGVNLASDGANPCEMLSGATCVDTDTPGRITATSAVGYTYFRLKLQGETCPSPASECEDQYTYVVVPKPSPPLPPPSMSACSSLLKGCGCYTPSMCGRQSCRYPSDGMWCSKTFMDMCYCKSPLLFSEYDMKCVSPGSCPCYHSDTPDIPRPIGSFWLSGDCKRKLACGRSGTGLVPKITSTDFTVSSCGSKSKFLKGDKEGFCICLLGTKFDGSVCIKIG